MLAKTAKPNYTIITVESFKFMETPFLDLILWFIFVNNGIQLDQVPKCIKDTRVKSTRIWKSNYHEF